MERKERGTGGAKDQNGLLPIFGSLSQQRMLTLCRDVVFHVATWFSNQEHDSAWVRAIGMRTRLGCMRDSATCAHDRAFWLCVAIRISMSRRYSQAYWVVLGHDRGLLCRDRDLSALCRDRNSVLQQEFGARPGLGRDKGLLVLRQSFPKGGDFLSR